MAFIFLSDKIHIIFRIFSEPVPSKEQVFILFFTMKELIALNEKEMSPYIRCVMNYFSCNEQMAKTILKSSKENGEFERIKNMCTIAPTERSAYK